MAEGIAKKLFGTDVYLQSAGVKGDLDIDGFAISVCQELEVELSRHRSRSFDEMEQWGDDLSSFDLIVSLSPASQRRALELTGIFHLEVVYWPIMDPTGLGETREAKLGAYMPSDEATSIDPDDLRNLTANELQDSYDVEIAPLEHIEAWIRQSAITKVAVETSPNRRRSPRVLYNAPALA